MKTRYFRANILLMINLSQFFKIVNCFLVFYFEFYIFQRYCRMVVPQNVNGATTLCQMFQRLLATPWQICYRNWQPCEKFCKVSKCFRNPLTKVSRGDWQLFVNNKFVRGLPVLTDHLLEFIDYPLKQLTKYIGDPLETFVKGLPHQYTKRPSFCRKSENYQS